MKTKESRENMAKRAIIPGDGGVVGIVWEIGVLVDSIVALYSLVVLPCAALPH